MTGTLHEGVCTFMTVSSININVVRSLPVLLFVCSLMSFISAKTACVTTFRIFLNKYITRDRLCLIFIACSMLSRRFHERKHYLHQHHHAGYKPFQACYIFVGVGLSISLVDLRFSAGWTAFVH